MPKWLRSDGSQNDDKEPGIEIKPEQIKEAMKPELDAFKTGLDTSLDAKMKPIVDYITSQQEKERLAEEARKRQQQQQQRDDSDVTDEDFITDPANAVRKQIQPLLNTVQAQSAIIMRNEVLGKMDLYSTDPAFKAKVDALLDAQPMSSRANSAIIMNAYKTVHYDERKAIEEGKYKSFASMASLSSGGKGGSDNTDDHSTSETLSAEEKTYAKRLGISDADWVKSRREMEYV